MLGFMDEFLPGPQHRLLHLTIITMIAYAAMSCSSQRTASPTPAVAQPRIEENTSSRDSSDQNGKKKEEDEDDDDDGDEEEEKKKSSDKVTSGSVSPSKGGASSTIPSPPGPVTTPPSMPPSLDPGLIAAACTAPTINGDAVKLRAFLNDPEARGNITPAQKAQALASIMGVSDADLQAALNMQCRPGTT